MIAREEFLIQASIETETLEAWIEAGWLAPRRGEAGDGFSDIDLARAQLIRDLRHDLGVNDEGVAVILDLVDQVHGLRRTLRELLSALRARPDLFVGRSTPETGPEER
jgi:chaperone modulatory protein CbpM